jgi:hypothetical protein|tara:strand:- start:671 stop:1111 length:441 start_codon:yes stop_codon:yes gene_type:complete
MKKLLLLLFLIPTTIFAQDCYTVKAVTTAVEMEEISQRRITFGIKQMMEDIISDKYDLCLDGKPVEVQVASIEAPTTGIEIGPWTKVSKKTIVTLLVYMDGKIIEVEGKAKSTVKATFIDLQNDQLPFNKTTFASAVKKAIEKSIK